MKILSSLLKTVWGKIKFQIYSFDPLAIWNRDPCNRQSLWLTHNHSAGMGLFAVFVRHVCEDENSHTCINVTKHVVPYQSIRVLRGVQLHLFITTSLNWAFLKCTIRPLYLRRNTLRHQLKKRPGRADRCDGLIAWSVSTRKIKGISAVDLCYGSYN
jgi:hypothetical protein